MAMPLVSVIIPTFNEEKNIVRLLKSLSGQTYKQIETLVIDDASTDNTVQLAKKSSAKVFARPHAERSVQRNFGASQASGKFLLFLDADMELSPDVVAQCVALTQSDPGIVGIAIPEEPVSSNYWESIKAFERRLYNLVGDPVTDAARFFLKSAFDSVGGYDQTLTGPEDWDLPETLREHGHKIGRIKAKIYHFERIKSPFQVAKKKYYYALSSSRYFKKHNLPVVSAKSVYFLRPIFYKNWRVLLKHPLSTLGLVFMMTLEQVFGGLGYLAGQRRV